jgi:arylsulfatase A-like enzyme
LPIVHNLEVVDEVKNMDDQAMLCKRFTDAAVEFIRQNAGRPFFVYLPHAFVHHPRASRREFIDHAENETEAQIEEVDWSVGQILDTVREVGIAERTLVIFTSDNGGARGCVNAPLRGGKGSAWEGGMREPTLAWWPERIPAGSVCDKVITAMDVLPTFAALAGAKMPGYRIIDGRDVLPLLLGRPGAKSPHEAFFYFRGERLEAVRSGPWKLFGNGRLYNLDQDIGESADVSAQHAQVVERLQGYLDRARRDLGDGEMPGKNCRPVGVARNPRTLLPRPGLTGDASSAPTLRSRE